MVYLNDKPILTVCDNTVFVKKLPQLAELMKDSDCGFPYDGAKECYILDIDNDSLVEEVIPKIWRFYIYYSIQGYNFQKSIEIAFWRL